MNVQSILRTAVLSGALIMTAGAQTTGAGDGRTGAPGTATGTEQHMGAQTHSPTADTPMPNTAAQQDVPNLMTGDTARENSTLQEPRDGNMGFNLGWLGLLGLGGLFGLGRGRGRLERAEGHDVPPAHQSTRS